MKAAHLSDEAIQAYIFNKSPGRAADEKLVVDHLLECEHCQAKADLYQQVFVGIKEQPGATFDFNLSGLVVSTIKKQHTNQSQLNLFWLFAIIAGGTIFTTSYLFRRFVLYSSASSMGYSLVITSAIVLLLFLGIDMYRKYKRQMTLLDFS